MLSNDISGGAGPSSSETRYATNVGNQREEQINSAEAADTANFPAIQKLLPLLTALTRGNLDEVGNLHIKTIVFSRSPIAGGVEKLIDALTLFSWKDAKKKVDGDRVFHLYCEITFFESEKVFALEKFSNVSLKNASAFDRSNSQFMVATAGPENFNQDSTLNKIFSTQVRKYGLNRFTVYNAFNSDGQSGNCQRFLADFTASISSMSSATKKELNQFILQDIEEAAASIPSFSITLAKKITDISAWLSRAASDVGIDISGFKKGGIVFNKKRF